MAAYAFAWMFLLCLGCACAQLPVDSAGGVAPAGPPPNLAQDLTDILSLIRFQPMNQLFVRYLLNDAQFQAFVRILNSNAGFTARWRLRSQPEVVLFQQWVSQQLLASGGQLELEELEICLTLINPYPYWSGTVNGWQGFLNELDMYLPQYAIQGHVQAKLLQPGIFAQFWRRVQSLQLAYERWLTMPATQTVVGQLQAEGIDTNQLDTMARNLFGWTAANATTTTTSTSTTISTTSTPAPAVSTPTEATAGAVVPMEVAQIVA